MSPRSEEFMNEARSRLGAARLAAEAGFGPSAVSAAYYAMLYAARAALSEEDRYAKTHSGTWNLFRESFVATGRFNRELLQKAERQQELREAADYEARSVSVDEAKAVLGQADEFVAAVEVLIGA